MLNTGKEMPSPRLWVLLAVAASAAGCATLAGLDQYEKGDADTEDATRDQTSTDVGADTQSRDSGSDATESDAASDVVTADVSDAGPAADSGDAGDCGVPNTTNDCSMCGAKCDGTNASSTTCNGVACVYQCKAGFSDCADAAPDLNGCECATPACCGSSCQTTHSNGIGQSYYNCVDAGTYTQAQALKACTAYTSDQFACQPAGCVGDAGDLMVCGPPDAGSCACWTYTGLDTGHVYKSGSNTCFCPSTNDLGWN